MIRSLSILACCFLLFACVPQASTSGSSSPPTHPHSYAGDWVDEQGAHFSLDADGVLGLPGQTARSGLTWVVGNNLLTLRSLDMPGGTPREDRLGIISAGSSKLELRLPGGRETTWRKSRDEVRRLEGTLFYRERMALPPQVVVSARLFLPGRETPVASSLAQVSGQVPLPFRLHYLAKDVDGVNAGSLAASILYENDSLFSTASPVSVSFADKPNILVERTLPGEADPEPLNVPAQFTGSRKGSSGTAEINLHLEPDGLYLLHTRRDGSGEVRVGNWKQIDRNHTIQFSRGASEPLTAALRPAGTLLLSTPDVPGGEVELKPTVAALPERAFRVTGMFRLIDKGKDGRGSLTECSSGLDFAVQTSGADYPSLEAAWRKAGLKDDDALLVDVEGTVRYRHGAPAPSRMPLEKRGVEDVHMLEITRFIAAREGKVCAEPYASVPLSNTYWRLMSLDGKPAQTFPNQAEPHLILRDKQQAAGSDGCNNFFMQWKSSGNSIQFEPGGSTLMLCPQGEAQAQLMMRSLADVDAWSINGSVLELRKGDKPLASFEAVTL